MPKSAPLCAPASADAADRATCENLFKPKRVSHWRNERYSAQLSEAEEREFVPFMHELIAIGVRHDSPVFPDRRNGRDQGRREPGHTRRPHRRGGDAPRLIDGAIQARDPR